MTTPRRPSATSSTSSTAEPRVQRLDGATSPTSEQTLFSNVNSAMPRAVWREFPFADDLIMSEDQEWSRRVLRAGYELVYEPDAAVHHSHRYSVADAFRRFFDSGVSAERSYAAGGTARARCAAPGRATRGARSRGSGDGPAPVDPVRRRLRAREVRRHAARPHHRTCRSLKRRFSALSSYWD